MTVCAVVVMLISTLVDIAHVHAALDTARTNLQVSVDTSKKIETQLDALAKGISSLAEKGNPNASAIVATLRQNGVNIKGDAKATSEH